MNKNLKEKPQKCSFASFSGPISLSSSSSLKSSSRTNFKFSLTERLVRIKWNLKKHKSIIASKILQFDFTCFGFPKTILKRPNTKITSRGYFTNWETSWAERKKIWTKVINFALNKVNNDKRRKNSNGWEPLSTGLTLSLTSTFTYPMKMTSWTFFWKLPATSWSTAWGSRGTSCAKRNKSWEWR